MRFNLNLDCFLCIIIKILVRKSKRNDSRIMAILFRRSVFHGDTSRRTPKEKYKKAKRKSKKQKEIEPKTLGKILKE